MSTDPEDRRTTVRKKGLVAAAAAFAASPQGKRLIQQAKAYVQSPEGRAKINDLKNQVSSRRTRTTGR
jgi:hypothetical protein